MSNIFLNDGNTWWCNTKKTGKAWKVNNMTWIEFWEYNTGIKPFKCHVQDCDNENIVGCHVNTCYDNDGTIYIIPLCEEHNGWHNGKFKLHHNAKLVVAPNGYGFINNDFFINN